ncbi:hypothetical protein [Collimonas sp. OK412]|jgi:hypothetical protein|uniref:hypothetical protein n=1 Tax=Collimonas sp. (strain OK412) TaxID=1801619 RepID=UPI0008E08E48|nr:hypothetical protein [Collimonas sp. OK412]SFB72312.1 hypothetical protein SAMN04515619_101197 [Collimonas sp. OK412]
MTAGKVAVALTLLAGFAAAPVLADNRNTAGAPATAVAAQDRFATPLTLRGTLGDAQIEMHLQQKPDPSEGIQGSYVIAGQSAKILLAGESDNADILMEESVNGKDVSGEWAGKLVGNTFSGTWSTTDDAVTKPFALTVQSPRAVK